jgi:dihydropteroate synthase
MAIMAPVSTVDQAVACAAAGARLIDVGAADVLIAAIRRAAGGLLICGCGEDADLVRDVNLAARTGAGLICRDLAAAQAAVGHRIAPDRILVWCTPAQIERAAESRWATLVDGDAVAGSMAGMRADAGSPADGNADAGSLVDVDTGAGSLTDGGADGGSLAGVLAVAAVCGWLGASVIWTRHVAGVRRALDMTEAIRGTRAPAWTIRGLA